MRLWKGILAAILIWALTVPVCAASGDILLPQQRQEDLDVLYSTLKSVHPDLFANTPEEEFLERKAEIETNLNTVDDLSFLLDMMSLTAMVGDSHTTMSLNSVARLLRAYPIAMIWRDGRWYISALPSDRENLLGQEVVAVARRPVDEVVSNFGAVLSADNPVKLRRQYRQSCNVASLYEYLGLVEVDSPLILTLAGGDTLELFPVSMEELSQQEIVQLGTGLPVAPTAGQDCYYCSFDLGNSTWYIQYNTCAEDPELPMETFAAQVEAELEQGSYIRVIVDLRNNGGGSDGVIWPLLEILRRAMDQGTELVGLIGETTFSSAIINAVELQEMGGVLVGDAASGSVDHFGSVGSFQLPNSGIRVGVSKKFIDLDTLFDAGAGRGVETLEPDIMVRQSMEDTLKGKDTVIEWLLSHPQELESQAYPDAPLTRGRFLALLWNKAGCPAAGDQGVADTFGIEWYLPALNWAAEQGIAVGTGSGNLQASRPVTRQEAAVMLESYASLKEKSDITPSDWQKIALWAQQSVLRTVAAGLMDLTDGAFYPQDTMTRAEGEVIVSRLSQ